MPTPPISSNQLHTSHAPSERAQAQCPTGRRTATRLESGTLAILLNPEPLRGCPTGSFPGERHSPKIRYLYRATRSIGIIWERRVARPLGSSRHLIPQRPQYAARASSMLILLILNVTMLMLLRGLSLSCCLICNPVGIHGRSVFCANLFLTIGPLCRHPSDLSEHVTCDSERCSCDRLGFVQHKHSHAHTHTS